MNNLGYAKWQRQWSAVLFQRLLNQRSTRGPLRIRSPGSARCRRPSCRSSRARCLGRPGTSAPEVEPWHIGIRREARLGKGGSPGSRFRALLLSTDYKQLYGEGPEGRVTNIGYPSQLLVFSCFLLVAFAAALALQRRFRRSLHWRVGRPEGIHSSYCMILPDGTFEWPAF